MLSPDAVSDRDRYVGTIVGESTSREFRLAVAHETVREQDIIAVDADLRRPDEPDDIERLRIWAKVQRIERLNPLFPSEAGHELAATRTDPFDTVLSLSREMVTAVCQVLGAEPIDSNAVGKLAQLRYPPRPATRAYRPESSDIGRVVLGDLQENEHRALDIAELANRPDVNVSVDGHALVLRHLAILAMTGAGKSWASRRIIEQLAKRNYPIVIFDPHGDYVGLADIPGLRSSVRLYHADLPIFDEDADDARQIISGLSGEDMTSPQEDAFESLFSDAQSIFRESDEQLNQLRLSLSNITGNDRITRFPFRRDLFALSYMAEAASMLAKQKNDLSGRDTLEQIGFTSVRNLSGASTYRALSRQLRRAAFELQSMEKRNRAGARNSLPLPPNRGNLVGYGQIWVVVLAGYSDMFQATLYSLIAKTIFDGRVDGKIRYPCLLVIEEAHNVVPGPGDRPPTVMRSINVTKQIAQEGRKFGVGLVLISQRPSRLDETTLSQCNSFVIMRMVNPADQSFVRRVIETLGEEEARMLPNLDIGEALLAGQMINFPVLVRMKQPESREERVEMDAFKQLEQLYRNNPSGASGS